jgi:aspartokinase/homoserine dehydrogenase 1
MIGVPGTAERVFAHLACAQRVGGDDLAGLVRAFDLLRGARREAEAGRAPCSRVFAPEIAAGPDAGRAAWFRGISVLAAVGDGMAGKPGVAARLFAALARARVNMRAIAQGASERNISVAIAAAMPPRHCAPRTRRSGSRRRPFRSA